ncbi:PREDICTED: adenylate cyclase type 10-like [Gavialis gangeticus]|uniref:adenylate cyclase type 10-like n=1 Tax=Gavialis gangeticus TaxID=94835 RepID=UPI00092E616F|nr:PREDICTED: adenylate cyclase type 10-like [Gavialis gangeticus]
MKALGKSPHNGREAAGVNFPSRLVQLAAFLPDLLVYNDHCSVQRTLPSIETFSGVLLCAEITGVLLYGGDILNFTGDVLLVLWKGSRSQLSNIITLVAEYSLSMQWWFEYSCSRVGLELQLKIGLSAGHISQLIVGDEKCQYLLVTGQQVDDAWLAQSLAETGEVILSPNCWELCKQDILEAKKIPGQRAVKLRYVKNLHQDYSYYEKWISSLRKFSCSGGELSISSF